MKSTAVKKQTVESGQAILELVLSLPIFLVLTGIMYRFNVTAQIGINNNQFARTQIYVLTHNSPEYPRLQFREKGGGASSMVDYGHNRMILSVIDPKGVPDPEEDDDKEFRMIPPEQNVVRADSKDKGSDELGEVTRRGKVRVRTSAIICTQSNFFQDNRGAKSPINSDSFAKGLVNVRWPFGVNVCEYAGGALDE